jgi:hypothetical protein
LRIGVALSERTLSEEEELGGLNPKCEPLRSLDESGWRY